MPTDVLYHRNTCGKLRRPWTLADVAKHDLERSLRTADLASGEEEEVRATEEPEETHRSTYRRATRDSQSLSSPERGRHN